MPDNSNVYVVPGTPQEAVDRAQVVGEGMRAAYPNRALFFLAMGPGEAGKVDAAVFLLNGMTLAELGEQVVLFLAEKLGDGSEAKMRGKPLH